MKKKFITVLALTQFLSVGVMADVEKNQPAGAVDEAIIAFHDTLTKAHEVQQKSYTEAAEQILSNYPTNTEAREMECQNLVALVTLPYDLSLISLLGISDESISKDQEQQIKQESALITNYVSSDLKLLRSACPEFVTTSLNKQN